MFRPRGAAVAAVCVLAALAGQVAGGLRAEATTDAVVPDARQLVLAFVPHADDDVLSMGVIIQRLVRTGHDVRVIYYTDGAGTGICSARGAVCTADNEFRNLPVQDFIAKRDSELVASVTALGVPTGHIEFYAPDGKPRRRDGTADVAFATQMLRSYRAQPAFRDATFLTMSWLDGHSDHGSAGQALRALVEAQEIPDDQALFTMARWYWAYDYPGRSPGLTRLANQLRARRGYPRATRLLPCDDDECRARVHAAVNAYKKAADGTGTGIGYRSVKTYLDVVDGDPEVLEHGADAGRYAARIATMPATRTTDSGSTATLRGEGAVPSVGTYPAPLDDPQLLAQSIVGSQVSAAFPQGTRVGVQAFDAAHTVVARTQASVTSSGAFAVTLKVPPTAETVTATSDPTQGLEAATGTWSVERQQLLGVRPLARGVSVHRGVVTGEYGEPFAVDVRTLGAGRPASGAAAELRPSSARGWRPPTATGRSDDEGVATVQGHLGGTTTWYLTAMGSSSTLPPPGTPIRTHVLPAALGVHPERTVVGRDAHHRAALAGRIVGGHHAIPAGLLAPARLRIWLQHGRVRPRLLRTVTTRPGGLFRTTVRSRRPGLLRVEVVGRHGMYAHVRSAARISLR